MRYFILGVALLATACATVRHPPGADPIKSTNGAANALEAFSGTWAIIVVQPDGATKDARQLVFNTDGTYAAQDEDGEELWSGTFEIDPTASPKIWDHRTNEAEKEGKDVLGIYDLDGDNLRVACVAGQWRGKEWVGRPRPKEFDLRQADVVIELERGMPNR